jgi:uncharacterized membrane protein
LIRMPTTENERLLSSVILVFITYFGLNSLIFAMLGEDSASIPYLITLSFLGGMILGVSFFLWTKSSAVENKSSSSLMRNIEVLKKALSDDERTLIDLISGSEGVTQDSIRFKTGFSKSKVSALLSELEKKDIISRERLGRTYKVFISDWLKK